VVGCRGQIGPGSAVPIPSSQTKDPGGERTVTEAGFVRLEDTQRLERTVSSEGPGSIGRNIRSNAEDQDLHLEAFKPGMPVFKPMLRRKGGEVVGLLETFVIIGPRLNDGMSALARPERRRSWKTGWCFRVSQDSTFLACWFRHSDTVEIPNVEWSS